MRDLNKESCELYGWWLTPTWFRVVHLPHDPLHSGPVIYSFIWFPPQPIGLFLSDVIALPFGVGTCGCYCGLWVVERLSCCGEVLLLNAAASGWDGCLGSRLFSPLSPRGLSFHVSLQLRQRWQWIKHQSLGIWFSYLRA
jgi:hypothetical protein